MATPEGSRSDPEELRRHGPKVDAFAPAAISDAAGHFRIEGIPEGAARIWAGHEGLAWQSTDVLTILGGREKGGLLFHLDALRKDDSITGQVLAPDGTPLEGARVRYFYTSARIGTGGAMYTDADGRFRLLVDHRVPHDFTVSDEEDRWSNLVHKGVEPGIPDLVFRFQEASWFELELLDQHGEPVLEYSVKATYDGPGHRDILERVRRQEHEFGVAAMRRPTHTFDLEIDAPGQSLHTEGSIDHRSLPERLTIRVSRLPSISGRVLAGPNGDTPVPGAQVELHEKLNDQLITVNGHRCVMNPNPEASCTADADGWFDLHLRDSGTFVLTAQKNGFARAELFDLALDGERGAEGLEIRMGPGGAIEGRVIVPPGVDPSGRVLAFNHGDSEPFTLRTGPDGEYRAERLAPGPWQVQLAESELHPGQRSVSYSHKENLPAMKWSCHVIEGQTTRHDVRFLGEGQTILLGSFLLGGRPASGFTASLWDHRKDVTSGVVRDSTVLDGGGRFTLEVLEPGPYILVLKGAVGDGEIRFREELELEPGTINWQGEIPAGAILIDHVESSAGTERLLELRWQEPPGGPRGGALKAETRVLARSDGTALLTLIPAGAIEIWRYEPSETSSRYGDWFDLRTVEVIAGREITVDLEEKQRE